MTGSHGRTVDIHAHVVIPARQELVARLMSPEYEPYSYGHMAEIAPKLTGPGVRIVSMNTSAAAALDRVHAVITGAQAAELTDPLPDFGPDPGQPARA